MNSIRKENSPREKYQRIQIQTMLDMQEQLSEYVRNHQEQTLPSIRKLTRDNDRRFDRFRNYMRGQLQVTNARIQFDNGGDYI